MADETVECSVCKLTGDPDLMTWVPNFHGDGNGAWLCPEHAEKTGS